MGRCVMAARDPTMDPFVPTTKATVFIVDDDRDARHAISRLVRSVGLRTEVYSSARQFLDYFDPNVSGCLVLDVQMPGIDGLELQKRLNARGTRIPIIFVTAYGEIPMATEAIRAGAVDFIPKPFDPQVMLERVQEAVQLDREIRRKQEMQNDVECRLRQLTGREREVMELLATGDSSKAIAAKLGIRPKTVDNHRAKIFMKMNVDNGAQLAWLVSRGEQGGT